MANGSPSSSRNLWVGIGIAAALIVGVILLLIVLTRGNGGDAASTTTTAPTTTTMVTTTTNDAATTTTTTTAPPTTVPGASGTQVAETPIVALLQPYNDGGAALLSGPVEAHWYQWEGLYVVLYRGIDAETATALCPGNSIDVEGSGFLHVSNSPFAATADEVCVDAPALATGESGVRACGSLLYYITEIPIDAEGVLYGTIEVNDGSGFVGLTSQVTADIARTPEFLPFQAAYTLAPSAVDTGGIVLCGS